MINDLKNEVRECRFTKWCVNFMFIKEQGYDVLARFTQLVKMQMNPDESRYKY